MYNFDIFDIYNFKALGKVGGVIIPNGWLIGQSGSIYGYVSTTPIGDLTPPDFETNPVYLLTVSTADATVRIEFGASGGERHRYADKVGLTVAGYAGGKIALVWDAVNNEYSVTDTTFTSFVVGNLGNTLIITLCSNYKTPYVLTNTSPYLLSDGEAYVLKESTACINTTTWVDTNGVDWTDESFVPWTN